MFSLGFLSFLMPSDVQIKYDAIIKTTKYLALFTKLVFEKIMRNRNLHIFSTKVFQYKGTFVHLNVAY